MLNSKLRTQIIQNLCVVVAGKDTELSELLLNKVLDVYVSNSGNVDKQMLSEIYVEHNDKRVKFNVRQLDKVLAGLDLLNISLVNEVPRRSKPAVERQSRSRVTHTYTKDSSDEEIRKISRLVCEWRIAEDGSRPLAWREIRGELKLANEEFHKVIRLSAIYREEVIRRINELRSRPEGWEYCRGLGKLESLTGIDITEDDLG